MLLGPYVETFLGFVRNFTWQHGQVAPDQLMNNSQAGQCLLPWS